MCVCVCGGGGGGGGGGEDWLSTDVDQGPSDIIKTMSLLPYGQAWPYNGSCTMGGGCNL